MNTQEFYAEMIEIGHELVFVAWAGWAIFTLRFVLLWIRDCLN